MDLLNSPAPMRRIKLVMTTVKIVEAVSQGSDVNIGGRVNAAKGTYWYESRRRRLGIR